jgi:hypothetical protein
MGTREGFITIEIPSRAVLTQRLAQAVDQGRGKPKSQVPVQVLVSLQNADGEPLCLFGVWGFRPMPVHLGAHVGGALRHFVKMPDKEIRLAGEEHVYAWYREVTSYMADAFSDGGYSELEVRRQLEVQVGASNGASAEHSRMDEGGAPLAAGSI